MAPRRPARRDRPNRHLGHRLTPPKDDSTVMGSPLTPEPARSSWVADAERYDHWYESPWGSYAFATERQAILAAAGNLAGKTVADIGCGTGRLTTDLERHAGRVVGLDPDPSMLAVAARRTAAPLIVGDGNRLPFGDRRFDVTIAITVCEFTTDPAVVTAELARVTRPGGRVVVGALNRHSPWGIANRHQFDRPPWDTARFITRAALRRLGQPLGTVHLQAALYPPRALPLITTWGPVLEPVGRLVAPRAGAFQVLTIDIHDQ
jgi:ubiquinone/menaquinone biosynthesis C-methylase UbiE